MSVTMIQDKTMKKIKYGASDKKCCICGKYIPLTAVGQDDVCVIVRRNWRVKIFHRECTMP